MQAFKFHYYSMVSWPLFADELGTSMQTIDDCDNLLAINVLQPT